MGRQILLNLVSSLRNIVLGFMLLRYRGSLTIFRRHHLCAGLPARHDAFPGDFACRPIILTNELSQALFTIPDLPVPSILFFLLISEVEVIFVGGNDDLPPFHGLFVLSSAVILNKVA